MKRVRRRRFLVHLSLLPLLSPAIKLWGMGSSSKIGLTVLKHSADYKHRPEAVRRLLMEVARRSSIETKNDAEFMEISEQTIFSSPLLILTGEQGFESWSEKQRHQLALHLRYGGLLWVDSVSGNSAFMSSVKRELALIFPEQKMKKLKADHVLFKSFYLLDRVYGRFSEQTRVFAYGDKQREQVIITECDVLGALERDRLGSWTYECVPAGEHQRERAIRFSVNLLMYALCLDYKSDQVHIPFIMKKKRR